MHAKGQQQIKQQHKKQTGKWSIWVCWYARTLFMSMHAYVYTQIPAVCVADSSTKHLQIYSILGTMPVGERRPSKQPTYLTDVVHDNLCRYLNSFHTCVLSSWWYRGRLRPSQWQFFLQENPKPLQHCLRSHISLSSICHCGNLCYSLMIIIT